jgi:hypothetical protein
VLAVFISKAHSLIIDSPSQPWPLPLIEEKRGQIRIEEASILVSIGFRQHRLLQLSLLDLLTHDDIQSVAIHIIELGCCTTKLGLPFSIKKRAHATEHAVGKHFIFNDEMF